MLRLETFVTNAIEEKRKSYQKFQVEVQEKFDQFMDDLEKRIGQRIFVEEEESGLARVYMKAIHYHINPFPLNMGYEDGNPCMVVDDEAVAAELQKMIRNLVDEGWFEGFKVRITPTGESSYFSFHIGFKSFTVDLSE